MNILTSIFGFTGLSVPRHLFVAILSTFLIAVNPVAAQQSLTFGGTGASLGTIKILGEAFQKSHPRTVINVLPSLGSGGGIKAISKGALDISLAGRPLKEKEKNSSLVARVYGRTPFLFAVNSRNTSIDNISLEGLEKIYNLEKSTWENGNKIYVSFRSKRESDTRFIRSISPRISEALDEAYKHPGIYIPVSDQESADFLEKYDGSFGVITLSQLITEKRTLRPLKLNGVAPTPQNIMNKKYLYYKPFYIVTKVDPSPLVQKFVDFVFSEKGRQILIETGHAPDQE